MSGDNYSISENIYDCKRLHDNFCDTLRDIADVYIMIKEYLAENAGCWTGESRAVFDKEMEKRFEEFLELMKYAENEEHFYQTWKYYVDKIHGIFDDLFEKIRNI